MNVTMIGGVGCGGGVLTITGGTGVGGQFDLHGAAGS